MLKEKQVKASTILKDYFSEGGEGVSKVIHPLLKALNVSIDGSTQFLLAAV